MQQVQTELTDHNEYLFKNFGESFSPEQSAPLIHAFSNIGAFITEQKAINEKNEYIFDDIQAGFIDFKENKNNLKVEIKKDLLVELATKADISDVRGDLKEDINDLKVELKKDINDLRLEFYTFKGEVQTEFSKVRTEMQALRGEMYTGFEKISGEINSLRIWMKMIVLTAIIAIALFSPNLAAIFKYLKIS
ncbi:hypothetical protein MHK_005030 [Candidatus Magnetomorum sp. HK-1]|nr:hypothetical protein MHK_005030 [Candidatus Magnetomorum sp. HK-1]